VIVPPQEPSVLIVLAPVVVVVALEEVVDVDLMEEVVVLMEDVLSLEDEVLLLDVQVPDAGLHPVPQ